MAGQPSALANVVTVWIGPDEAVEDVKVAISQPRPTGAKFGPKGLIGIYRGQALCKIDLEFAQVADKSQFEAFKLAQEDPIQGFPFTFTKGASRFLCQPCFSGDASMDNTFESGDISVRLSIVGAPAKQIA